MGVSYSSAIGPIPDIRNTAEWRDWAYRLVAFREFENDSLYAGATRYYFATDGNDANDGLSEGSPKQTKAEVQNVIDSAGGPIIVSFKRGQVWRENSTTSVDKQVCFNTWGTGPNPILSAATVVISGASGWSNTTGTTWSIDTDTAHGGAVIGWIIITANSANRGGYDRLRWPLQKVSSQAEVEANVYSWWQNVSTKVLYVNIGTDLTITNLSFEATDTAGTAQDGFTIEEVGGGGTIVDGLDLYLWGNEGSTSNNGWCVNSRLGGTDTLVVRNTTMAYCERHTAGHSNNGASIGGIDSFIRCTTAYTQTDQQSAIVFDANDHTGAESIVAHCWFPGGFCQETSFGVPSTVNARGIPYDCHASSDYALRLAIGNKYEQLAAHPRFMVAGFGVWTVSASDEANWNYKAFHADFEIDLSHTNANKLAFPVNRNAIINGHIKDVLVYSTNQQLSLNTGPNYGACLNSTIAVDLQLNTQTAFYIARQDSITAPTTRYHHCHFHWKNLQAMGGSRVVGLWHASASNTLDANTSEVRGCIFTAEGASASSRCNVGASNTPANLIDIAIGPSIDGATDTVNDYGVGNADNLILLPLDFPPGEYLPTELIGECRQVTVQRDALGLLRPSTPTIGPYEGAPPGYDPQVVFDRVANIHAKLPTKARIAGSDNATGDVELDDATGDYPGSIGNVSGRVLGNGATAFAGVGVRADNRDGQDIAAVGDAMALTSGERSTLASAVAANPSIAQLILDAAASKTAAESADDKLPNDFQTQFSDLRFEVETVDGNVNDIKSKTDPLDFTGTSGTLKSESTNMRGTDGANTVTPDNAGIAAAQTAAESAATTAISINTKIGTPQQTLADDIADVQAGGVTIPVIQVPVPASRTWILKPTGDGLRGELPLVRTVGEDQPFAVDFRNDLPNNGRLISLESIDFVGPDGGIVIDAEDQGVDRSEAKFTLQLLEVGTYVITLSVEYDDSDGGGTSTGAVSLIVK